MTSNQLHRYRVLESLGKGGSGEVFLGADPFGLPVAIKIQRRPRKRNRFMQEYKILNEFPHPSLVKVHEFGLMDEGWSYLILGLIEGKSATAFVRSLYGSERLYKCIQIAIKISEAFGSLHQMGWIHGDIKSNNILVDKHGIPHLIDFELARSVDDTGQGKFFGTRSYAPPEQHEGKRLDASVDVYAMAGVLYRMITNKPAFQRVDNAKEAEHRRTTPPNISRRIPKKLKLLLLAALSPEPHKRPPNGYAFADMLRQCLTVPEPVIIQKVTPPAIRHLTETLQNYSLDTETHTLALSALSGGDPSLVSRFAHHYSQHEYWVPEDYHEQVWHYLQHLPETTQQCLYLLACMGGQGTTSLLHKFTGAERNQITKALSQLPHWVRKEGVTWNLYIGATHYACTHLIAHTEGVDRLLESPITMPLWAQICIQALQEPEAVLQATEDLIYREANTTIQWRLLQRLAAQEYVLQHLLDLLIHRQNGNWLKALQLRNDAESLRLLSIFNNITTDDLPVLQAMTKSQNIDVWVVSHALLAEWAILHGHFSTAERWIKPLSSHIDNYPRLLGLQQRALLYHHLEQQNRLEQIYRDIENITAKPITSQLRLLIANKEWTSNLFAVEEVPSLYLKVRTALEQGQPVEEDLVVLVERLPVLERSMLSVHPLWGPFIDKLNLPPEPKQAEFRYVIDSEDNL